MQTEIDMAVGLIVLLCAFLLFAVSCLAVAGVLRLGRWLADRYRWMRWFSL